MRKLHLLVGVLGFAALLVIVSPIVLFFAFLLEAPTATPVRVITGVGVALLTLGMIAHLPNWRLRPLMWQPGLSRKRSRTACSKPWLKRAFRWRSIGGMSLSG